MPEPDSAIDTTTVAPIGRMAVDLTRLALAIKIKRRVVGKTAEDVAADIGVSPATVRRAEDGALIDIPSFVAFCRWLQLPADDLLGLQPRP